MTRPVTERTLKIVTFNINGIKARLPRLLEYLTEQQPDIAVLQEIKTMLRNCSEHQFIVVKRKLLCR